MHATDPAQGANDGVDEDAAEGAAEQVLPGGNANHGLVVRVGETVHRPQHRHSRATHALLRHLEEVGFAGAPRFLGIDTRGREVLTYIEGQVATPPYPGFALTDEALTSVATLVRRYHEALSGFDASPHSWPRPAPAPFHDGTISHNDVKPENVVFRDGRAVALLDFDLAAPGSRLWDVATAARLWTPLRDDADIADQRRGRVLPRLRLFLDAYGLTSPERDRLTEAVIASHSWGYEPVLRGVAEAHSGFSAYWREVGTRAQRTRAWYETALPDLVTATT